MASNKLRNTGIGLGATALVVLVVGGVCFGSLFEHLSAGNYLIVQSPVAGEMTVHTTPGLKWQGFGSVWEYPVQTTVYFSKYEDEGGKEDQSVHIRFNDGGTAEVTASVQFYLPANFKDMIEIHKRFRSYEGLLHDGVRQLVGASLIRTAALMSAEQSYTTHRGTFPAQAWDQVKKGLFLTEQHEKIVTNPLTKETSIKRMVRIKVNDQGQPLRKANWVGVLGIDFPHFTVKDIDYEEAVDKQISKKREALMQIVEARAQAERAKQDRLTAEEEGLKNVAIAKYEAEVIKEKAVITARQKLAVAELDKQSAEQTALAKERIGKAEATVRRALMESDGALTLRLNSFVEIERNYAAALAANGHALVPQVVFSGREGKMSSATDLIQLLTAKTARDLGVDLSVSENKE